MILYRIEKKEETLLHVLGHSKNNDDHNNNNNIPVNDKGYIRLRILRRETFPNIYGIQVVDDAIYISMFFLLPFRSSVQKWASIL